MSGTLCLAGRTLVGIVSMRRPKRSQRSFRRSGFILAGEVSSETCSLVAPRRCIPFVEKDGGYWGNPQMTRSNSRTRTAARNRASFIGFVSSTFWWLEHYAGCATTACAVSLRS